MPFKTNLDLAKPFVQKLQENVDPSKFSKGDRIRFSTINGLFVRELSRQKSDVKCFELEVVDKIYDVAMNDWEIELHIPSYWTSIKDWEDWFKRHIMSSWWQANLCCTFTTRF